MPASEQLLDNLAGAVLDEAAVDWALAESSAGAAAQPLVRDLQLIASIASLFRDVTPSEPAGTSPATGQESADLGCWGNFRLLERVGQGAFGEVFRAWDTRLAREVALKLLPAEPLSNPLAASETIQEGRLLAKVRHPNVVTVHGAEQIGDQVGVWMEFIRGSTLEQLIQRGTVFRAADVIGIGVELCHALSAVHAAGLLHRDIKAQNVIRTEEGRVVLMDFGTGKEFADASSSDLTGTPMCLAPEVLAGRPATVQSDIYSLGVLLYHIVTGSYPVRGRTIRDLRRAHEQHERVPLRTSRPDVQPALARVIERACDSHPERRNETAAALARDLIALQRRPGVVRIAYQATAAAAVLLIAVSALEFRARRAGDRRGPVSQLASLFAGAPSPVEHPVIAVLPFKNFSSEPGRDLLVDSVTTGLIRQLSIIDGLQVKSQHSSFVLKDKPLSHVGKMLGVNLVIEGDAQLSGRTLVINAAMVSVADDRPLWSGKVERQLTSEGDIVGAVEDVTRTVVNKLRLKLHRTQRRYETIDIPMYETYLRARALRDGRANRAREAIPLFEEVIRKDPSYAPALAALAATYGSLGIFYPDADLPPVYMPHSEAAARAEPLATKALEIDPMLAEAHAAFGYLHSFARQWESSEASFRRAIDFDPSLTALYGDFVLATLMPWGRVEESMSTMQKALQADPLSLDVRRVLALVQISAGRYDDALENLRRVLDEQPKFPGADLFYARALLFSGRKAEALDRFNQFALAKKSAAGQGEGVKGWIHAISGRRAEAEEIAARFAHFPQRQVEIYGLLGDNDRTVEALERLAVLNPGRAAWHLSQPELASLRGDPRVEAFRRKLGFPR
jgi:TolB-like protein/Tfp pilus assembly protein PilF/tRNA A-37 threonylcarbamoyl transferase component Bud32